MKSFSFSALACVALLSCIRVPQPLPGSECRPTGAALGLERSVGGLSGSYNLTLVATNGPRRGRTSDGSLQLISADVSDRSPDSRFNDIRPVYYGDGFPYYGAARIDLAAVGASTDGDMTSIDPIYPGVLVTDFRRTDPDTRQRFGEVEATLGGANNRRDGIVVTGWGSSTTLLVRELAPNGFLGSWRSNSDRVTGFFCAVRNGA